MNMLVVFYSLYGHIYKMAEAVMDGAKSVENTEAKLYRVPETLPDEVLQNEELIHYYAKILKDDFSLLKHYFQDGCSASIETDIAVWCGKDDAMISASEVRKWHQVTAGRCTITDFEGGHFFINQVFGDLHDLERQLHVCRNAYRGERDDLY